ncbi:hypothetical protein [Sphingobium vermicomposti]|uniref:MFS family permease n=1 Tax=Sphingobium vermicomposti TaxID=529005 RepID=A0A846MFD2_9SPHN|nr:hypothetical protein [Sphingobium vermicomposti]NIJ15296.1 MFS family permease [Sphingobium vermicomposti]
MGDREIIEKHSDAKRGLAVRLGHCTGHVSKTKGKNFLLEGWLPSAAILFIVAVVTRAACVGDPAVHMDEEFYLLVADRIWQGALPYVDIWDRKPIGLFLIYALLRPLSPNGVVAYQLGALICAFLTALIVRRMCLHFCDSICATLSGVLYLLFLPLLGGVGGQAPVFYNILMGGSASLVIQTLDSSCRRWIRVRSYMAMALCGIAIQIKYTVVFEGVTFGLWLLWREWRESASAAAVTRHGLILISIALVPTVAVGLFYASIGYFAQFFDANFLSLTRVVLPQSGQRLQFLVGTTYLILPLLLMGLIAAVPLAYRPFHSKNIYLISWTIAAAVGFFSVGNNYPHYALPALMPLSILSGTLFKRGGAAVGLVSGSVWYVVLFGLAILGTTTERRHRVEAMVAALRPYAAHGCIYVNDGPTVLYLLTSSCLPTPYIFPEHLNNAGENAAVNAPSQMRKLLRTLPAAILLADKELDHPRNRTTAGLVERTIRRHYHEIARVPDVFSGRQQIIYARSDLK